ncbi:uncharacterized protein ATC70_012522 [Mucor velutinosus]|uniref:Phosphodiesterase n=1 Tax=Mucor velutinosus TaxID=708070 RepID=A0AAN7D5Q2_9FUNG|nr:hypothetical protein ATC70_012522 [Mucor velutinosus]
MAKKQHSLPCIFIIDIDRHWDLFGKICQSIQYYSLLHIVPIACSEKDDTSLMLKCIQMGAFDFVLKPFREPVIKTLFLNLFRDYKPHQSKLTDKTKQSALSQFQGRLQKLYSTQHEHHWLSDAIIKQYTPQPTIEGRSRMSSLTSERKSFLQSFIKDWNFSPLGLDDIDLVYCVFYMLDQTFQKYHSQLKSLQMTNDALYNLIFDVCNSYHNSNPYHNFRHAVDVMQSTWYFLNSIASESMALLLRPIDVLSLLMAAIGHDVGHPGVNNGFMATVLYNDKSVLENYHSMAFFNLLRKHYFNAMIDIKSHCEYKDFRKIIVQSILCTDMSCHQEYVESFKEQLQRLQSHTMDLTDDASRDKERMILCSIIMKCADVSNCARPFDNAKNWAITLAEEFFIQGDLERELGIPSIAIHERGKVTLADFQLSFMRNVALELYQTVGELLPPLKFCAENINRNIDIWTSVRQ